ncbi:MAG: rRNA maturation RNase YbeY [Candidatus Berkelbacteria bacterium]|nr:rRNA maturation RNase YbeY [Candidatus Berkelbacteria bacterium]
MKLYFEDKSNSFKASDFERIARLVFKKLEIDDKIELGLKLTDNAEIQKLNQKYRDIDEPTDVLSFSIDIPDKKAKKINLILGDIVISTEFAKEYSRKDNKTVKDELIELFKHGLLHLAGYDHKTNLAEWQGAEKRIKQL